MDVATRRLLVHRQRLLERKLRGLHRAEVREEDRHVEVRAPLPRRFVGRPAGKRVFEVQVVLEVVPAALHGL